jgi:hypothetical protein
MIVYCVKSQRVVIYKLGTAFDSSYTLQREACTFLALLDGSSEKEAYVLATMLSLQIVRRKDWLLVKPLA